MPIRKIVSRVAIALALVALVIPSLAVEARTAKPVVAIIRAEWCGACEKLAPTMKELMGQYGDRLEFVMFDVSDDQRAAEAAAKARELGISSFFEENKKKTSTVAVFATDGKLLFKTAKNYDRSAYVRAFDEAIAKSGGNY